jgi:hypothetical protein
VRCSALLHYSICCWDADRIGVCSVRGPLRF